MQPEREMILRDGVPLYVAVGFVDEDVAMARARKREELMVRLHGEDWERKLLERAKKHADQA